jgi:hypothetical protein
MPRPSNSNERVIILQPTNMQNADVDVWVDGKKQLKIDLEDKERQIMNYRCLSTFHGSVRVKIKVNKGSLTLSPNDAYGVYPAVYDNDVMGDPVEGYIPFKQMHNVIWIVNQEKYSNVEFNEQKMPVLKEGDVFEYDHLIPNGPGWVDLYFNNESDRLRYIDTKIMTNSMVERCMFQLHADFFVKDTELDVLERTEKLAATIGQI